MKKVLKYMTVYDKILIISILIISLSFIIFPVFKNWIVYSDSETDESTKKYIVIQHKNKIIQRVSLDSSFNEEPMIFKVKGDIGISKIEIYNGRVRIKKAPEKDPMKVCEKTGWISTPGPSIICVPNQITVWIEATQNNGIDGVTW